MGETSNPGGRSPSGAVEGATSNYSEEQSPKITETSGRRSVVADGSGHPHLFSAAPDEAVHLRPRGACRPQHKPGVAFRRPAKRSRPTRRESSRSRTQPLPEGRAHLRFRRPAPWTRRPGRSGVDTNASTSAALVPCGIRALRFATVGTSPTARHRMGVAVTWPGSTLERAPLRSYGARLRPRGPNRPAARPCRARCRGFDYLPLPAGSRPESGRLATPRSRCLPPEGRQT